MDPAKTDFNPAKKAFSLWGEFRKFAFKGNMIDLAVAVVIGAAFAKIIDSLVKDIIMPLVSLALPKDGGYENWKAEVGGVIIPYGHFIAELVNFLIVAFAIFLFTVKFLGWIGRARQEEAAKPPPLSRDQELLTEIRDLLKARTAPGEPAKG
ncbi:MAG: large conductance mechanosensitive channel protein MscL [Gemmataceae bacterium]